MRLTDNESANDKYFSNTPFGTGCEGESRFLRYLHHHCPSAKDFQIPLRRAFDDAAKKNPSIMSSPGVLGGSPCLRGTRIPVYMVLDAIEYYGTLEGALISYPQLNIDQVREAVRFAKSVMERPVDNKAQGAD